MPRNLSPLVFILYLSFYQCTTCVFLVNLSPFFHCLSQGIISPFDRCTTSNDLLADNFSGRYIDQGSLSTLCPATYLSTSSQILLDNASNNFALSIISSSTRRSTLHRKGSILRCRSTSKALMSQAIFGNHMLFLSRIHAR